MQAFHLYWSILQLCFVYIYFIYIIYLPVFQFNFFTILFYILKHNSLFFAKLWIDKCCYHMFLLPYMIGSHRCEGGLISKLESCRKVWSECRSSDPVGMKTNNAHKQRMWILPHNKAMQISLLCFFTMAAKHLNDWKCFPYSIAQHKRHYLNELSCWAEFDFNLSDFKLYSLHINGVPPVILHCAYLSNKNLFYHLPNCKMLNL